MQRVFATLLVVSGLAIAGWVALDDTGDDVGQISVAADDGPEGPASPSPTSSPTEVAQVENPENEATPSPTSSQAPDALEDGGGNGSLKIAVRAGGLGEVDLSRPPAPTGIGVASLGIEAPVVSVGVDSDGNIIVPDDVNTIGWYQGSRAPGAGVGNTVLIGHVDSRTQGRGAFFDLRVAGVGAEISLIDGDGENTRWSVTGRRTIEKSSIPMDDINQYYGEQRLVLITCGGDFNSATGSYESIVIVEAVPVA